MWLFCFLCSRHTWNYYFCRFFFGRHYYRLSLHSHYSTLLWWKNSPLTTRMISRKSISPLASTRASQRYTPSSALVTLWTCRLLFGRSWNSKKKPIRNELEKFLLKDQKSYIYTRDWHLITLQSCSNSKTKDKMSLQNLFNFTI